MAYLSHLVATVPTSLHIAEYGHSVKHYSFRRKAIQFGDKMKVMGFNEPDVNNIMKTASSEFINLQNSLNKPLLLTPDDLMKTAINHFADINNAERKPSLSFGFNNLDSITGGIFPGELWVIGARAKHGKTTIGWQIANSSCNKYTKRNCLFISLEMRPTELLEREAASLTGWKMSKVRSKKTDDEYDYLLLKISEQSESHIYYFGVSDSSGLSVKDMESMATYMQKAYGLDMIVVDHLHLISDSDSKTEYERVTNVSRSLKMLALSLDVPILCLAQLNREVERRDVKNKRPVLSDIRGSGAVEQDANGILFFYRYNMYAGQEIVTGYDNLNQTDKIDLIDRDYEQMRAFEIRAIDMIIENLKEKVNGKLTTL